MKCLENTKWNIIDLNHLQGESMKYTKNKPEGYKPRLLDKVIENQLNAFGAIEICGARWSGKSWTAEAFSNSIVRVDEQVDLYNDDPNLALLGEQPHAIDEWQDATGIWNKVRHEIDDSASKPGQFILTGSSTPPSSETRHSGAGRIARLRMQTMTLYERGLSTGKVHLEKLFNGEFTSRINTLTLSDYATIICNGGWPALLNADENQAHSMISQYLESLFDISMREMGKDPQVSRKIAMSLARNVGTSANLKTIAQDASEIDGATLSEETIRSYLSDFTMNYFIFELPGWDAPVRSKSRVRTKPKRYLDDPSMATTLLNVNPERLLSDGQLLGIMFESLCIHDLSVYARLLPNVSSTPLRYYSDSDGLEVDAIIELIDGRWAAFEIKLSESKVDEAAKNLNRLKKKISLNPAAKNREPEFMAVIVANAPYARQRPEDGIYVIPLGTLSA